jgi:ATP-dependent protease ClpP protease subunit
MEYNWNTNKRKYSLMSEGNATDGNENENENKTEKKKKFIWDGLTDTCLVNSVKNHIYFYSGVTTKSCMNLNIEIRKIANDIMSNRNNFKNLDTYIYIHINSFGGSVFAAMSTIDTIINCPIPIVTIIEGAAASAATLISVVADHRIITRNSFMLIHQLSSMTWGKMEDLEEEMGNLRKLMNRIKKIYTDKTKLKGIELDEILKHDIWWESKKCLEVGLVDKIIDNDKFYKIKEDCLEI